MLKAGFSRLDVTPPFGAELAGYYTVRIADGILDPIYLNSVAISNGNETVLLMAIDFIGINMDYNLRIRKAVSEKTGVPLDHIFVSAMHQHTSCALDHSFSRLTDEVFISVLVRKFADAAKMSIDDLKDAKIGAAARDVEEPIAFVRRYIADDGSVHTNPSSKINIVKRCDEADNTMRLVRLYRDGANDIAIVNFSTHPDVIGGTKFSADWMGFTRRFVEADIADTSCIFFTGTQGDSNHIDFFKPKEERIKGNSKNGSKGYGHSEYMGRIVANAVCAAWDNVEPLDDDSIFAEHIVIYNKTNTEGIDEYDKYLAYCEAYNNGTLDKCGTVDIAYAHRIVNLRTSPILLPIPITVIGIGNITFVGFGGEPFSAYGRYVRALAPNKFIVCAVCTNGYQGYFPTEEAFVQGAYEARSSLFTPTVEKEIIGAIDNILKKF